LKLSFNHKFWGLFRRLPPHVREQADRAFDHLVQNPRHPGLRLKCINKAEARYSIRIGGKYRALGIMEGDTITFDWIGPHGTYDYVI
jgi:hypothetical protein